MFSNTMFSENRLSSNLKENIHLLCTLLPIHDSFDFVIRELVIGGRDSFFLSINGFCRTEVLQNIFSDLQSDKAPLKDKNIESFIHTKINYAQVTFTDSLEDILQNILSGPSLLLIDGFDAYTTEGSVKRLPSAKRLSLSREASMVGARPRIISDMTVPVTGPNMKP